MINILAWGGGVTAYSGLSTDTKPVSVNGDSFFETDTGKSFYRSANAWGEVTASGNLTGHVTSTGSTTSLGSFTVAQLNTAISDADVATGGGTATGTNTGNQTIALTGDVTGSGTGSFAATIANSAVTFVKTNGIFSRVITDVAIGNVNTAQTFLPAAADTLTVAGATAYDFEVLVELAGMGGTTRTTAFLFGGTASFTSCFYYSTIHGGVANAVATAQTTKYSAAATAQVLAATSTAASHTILIRGRISINGAGTIIPQIQFSADPTGTILCKAGSFFRAWEIGSNVIASQGAWA